MQMWAGKQKYLCIFCNYSVQDNNVLVYDQFILNIIPTIFKEAVFLWQYSFDLNKTVIIAFKFKRVSTDQGGQRELCEINGAS